MNGKRLSQLVSKAMSASPKELQFRLKQTSFAARNFVASRRGGSALSAHGHLRSIKSRSGELQDWWRNQTASSWFRSDEHAELIRRQAGESTSGIPWVIAQADLVLNDRMPLFSYDPVDFRGPDRWHHDFILNKTAPRKFHGLIRYLDVEQVGDSKHVWEPNRFGWAYWLGVAWLATGNDQYANKFFELLDDWFLQNPYPIGINYCSALEVALRNYAWLWSLKIFSTEFDDRTDLLDKLICGIWTGCHHIEANLSTYFAPNTHLIGEGFGLFVCGAALPEFTESARWRSLGQQILADQAKCQFHHDGMHRELSSAYHLYSTDFYTHAIKMGQQTGFPVSQPLVESAKRMHLRLSELAPDNLLLPQFNDCDGGRLVSLVEHPLDAGPTLMAGEMLFEDLALIQNAQPTRGYPLLFGDDNRTAGSPLRNPRSFPMDRDLHRLYDSGIVTYQSHQRDYLAFRASPFGYHDCPHSHDAGLGIILHFNDVPILVDSGVGSYTQSEQERNQFRGAEGKNTILVNGRGPSKPEGWFEWSRKTDCELVLLKHFADGFIARGTHRGYTDDADHYTSVQREVILLSEGIVAVVDRWDSDEELAVESRFTLHPEINVDPASQTLHHPDQVVYFSAALLSDDAEAQISHHVTGYSENYGQTTTTASLAVTSNRCRRGGVITVFSRVGKIEKNFDRTFRFSENESGIHLAITRDGVVPRRTESRLGVMQQFN